MNQNKEPTTFEEVVVYLPRRSSEVLSHLAGQKQFIFNASRTWYVRNQYKLRSILWEPEMKEYMVACAIVPILPDNTSMTIIEAVWKRGSKQ